MDAVVNELNGSLWNVKDQNKNPGRKSGPGLYYHTPKQRSADVRFTGTVRSS